MTPSKSSITQRLRTNWGRSDGVTTVKHLVWLTGLRTGSCSSHSPAFRSFPTVAVHLFDMCSCLKISEYDIFVHISYIFRGDFNDVLCQRRTIRILLQWSQATTHNRQCGKLIFINIYNISWKKQQITRELLYIFTWFLCFLLKLSPNKHSKTNSFY